MCACCSYHSRGLNLCWHFGNTDSETFINSDRCFLCAVGANIDRINGDFFNDRQNNLRGIGTASIAMEPASR